MDSNKFIPNFLGEARVGTYYVSSFISLKVDDKLKTIWLDLETDREHFNTEPISDQIYPIVRTSIGKKSDFSLYLNPKFLPLFQILWNLQKSIIDNIRIILNPQILEKEQENLIPYISQLTQNFTNKDRKELIQFGKMVLNVQKESLPKLLGEEKYALIFGSLPMEKEIENIVATQSKPDLKKHNISIKDFKECFDNIVLDEKIYTEVFTALGLHDILAESPQLPKSGGAIFIDMGGTGKSEMKKNLSNFWKKKLGGECIHKNGIAEFSGDVNYARLIGSWYYGNKDNQSGYDREGLFNAAIRTKVPSLLIIDEADRFVKSSEGEYRDTAAELIIPEFKKYLQGRDKGGVQGYVLTLFIANVDMKYLNSTLTQGGERLSVIYFGPPTNKNDWLKLIDIYFKNGNLKFYDRDQNKDSLLANLLLLHNSLMSEEVFMIPPRKFGSSFCENYLKKYSLDEEEKFDEKDLFSRLYAKIHSKKNKEIIIHYNDFLKHLIEDLLLKEVKLAGLNETEFRDKYYKFINFDFSGQNTFDEKSEDFELAKKELIEIFHDKDTQRIMRAQYGFEVLGVKFDESEKNYMTIWRILNKKFIAQGGEKYEFEGKLIKSKIARECLNYISAKINSTNKKDIKQKVDINYNWKKYEDFINR